MSRLSMVVSSALTKLGGILKEVNFRKNYASTLTPDGVWMSCCSIAYRGGSIHAEDALLRTYNLLYGTFPPFVRNWRTIASGEVKVARPCSQCWKLLIDTGYKYVELFDGEHTQTELLEGMTHNMSSGTRAQFRRCS